MTCDLCGSGSHERSFHALGVGQTGMAAKPSKNVRVPTPASDMISGAAFAAGALALCAGVIAGVLFGSSSTHLAAEIVAGIAGIIVGLLTQFAVIAFAVKVGIRAAEERGGSDSVG